LPSAIFLASWAKRAVPDRYATAATVNINLLIMPLVGLANVLTDTGTRVGAFK
jgi:hypothetical protein